MLLIDIDKVRYRRHFNIVIATCISFLVASSLAISQMLIYLFPSQQGTHFHWNLLGVVSSVIIIVVTFNAKKAHPFLYEVRYVWELKHSLNLITRKMKKLTQAAKMGDKDAMLALQFSYQGSRQLWMLDDNLITLNRLDKCQYELNELLAKYDVKLEVNEYRRELLKRF